MTAWPRLDSPSWSRALSAAFVVTAGSVLGLSLWLDPSTEGHGTHLQLGLGPCTFLSWTGYPCPMCGMTTTFSLLAHGRVLQAAATQPFGLVLFGLTVAVFAVGLVELVRPTLRWHRLLARLAPYEAWLAVAFLVGMGLGWTYKIADMLWWHIGGA